MTYNVLIIGDGRINDLDKDLDGIASNRNITFEAISIYNGTMIDNTERAMQQRQMYYYDEIYIFPGLADVLQMNGRIWTTKRTSYDGLLEDLKHDIASAYSRLNEISAKVTVCDLIMCDLFKLNNNACLDVPKQLIINEVMITVNMWIRSGYEQRLPLYRLPIIDDYLFKTRSGRVHILYRRGITRNGEMKSNYLEYVIGKLWEIIEFNLNEYENNTSITIIVDWEIEQ